MDFIWEDRHRKFQQEIREFAQQEIAPLADEAEKTGVFPVEIMRTMAQRGFLGRRFPAKYGGRDDDVTSACISAEEIGKISGGINASILAGDPIALNTISEFGTEKQKQAYLAPSIRGEKIAAIAMTEPEVGSDVSGVKTTAVRDGDFYVLDGEKTFVTNGNVCSFVVVAARTGTVEDGHRGLSLIVVDRDTPGLEGEKLLKLGWVGSDTALLKFSDCRVPVENLVGEEGKGFYHLMGNLDLERVVVAALCLGLAQAAFDLAVDYAKQRKQFGRPIATFQDIRFMLVDMHTGIESARLLTYQAAWVLDQGRPATREASLAKYHASEVSQKAARDSLQIHGGHGFMMYNKIQRLYRDAAVLTIGGGTSQIQKLIIAKQLGL